MVAPVPAGRRAGEPQQRAIIQSTGDVGRATWSDRGAAPAAPYERLIAQALGVSAATVASVWRRAGLSRWRELEPRAPVQRYEPAVPGELIHLDTKKLGRIERPGHRVTGGPRDHTRGVGWEFVHVAIDDHSCTALAALAADERQDSAVRLVAHYRQSAVHVQRVVTDNGSAYRSRAFAAACRRLARAICTPSPIRRKPTARPSASSRPSCANGRMPRLSNLTAAPRRAR